MAAAAAPATRARVSLYAPPFRRRQHALRLATSSAASTLCWTIWSAGIRQRPRSRGLLSLSPAAFAGSVISRVATLSPSTKKREEEEIDDAGMSEGGQYTRATKLFGSSRCNRCDERRRETMSPGSNVAAKGGGGHNDRAGRAAWREALRRVITSTMPEVTRRRLRGSENWHHTMKLPVIVDTDGSSSYSTSFHGAACSPLPLMMIAVGDAVGDRREVALSPGDLQPRFATTRTRAGRRGS